MGKSMSRQIGGEHYVSKGIQPLDYIRANGLGFEEGNILKYITRWRSKGGVQDLEKARHYLDLLIEYEENNIAVECDRIPSDVGFDVT
jgi:hypothetical protein